MATTIAISDITTNVATTGSGSEIVVTGDGYFDDLMETINTHLKAQFDASRLTGDAFARVYMGMAQAALGQSIQFALAKRNTEVKADIAEKELLVKTAEATVATGTTQFKIDMAECQKEKVCNEASYIGEQKTQLIASVKFNNQIKAIDSLADTYGTFGAGGLTVSSDMWDTYYTLIANLVDELIEHKGDWNASTNTPDLPAMTTMVEGDFYKVTADGSTDLDGIEAWIAGEIAYYNGTRWEKSIVTLPSNTVTKVT